MDGFYRGIEVSLIGFAFLIGLGAILLPSLPGGLPGDTQIAVTFPTITVTAHP